MTTESTDSHDNEYQRRCRALRAAFDARPAVQAIFYQHVDPKLMTLFMIHWSCLSAGLSEPIPRYLKRAADNCESMGLAEMAEYFGEHAGEEDGHDNWAKDDTERLVNRWNLQHGHPKLDAEALLSSRLSPVVRSYHELHERVIDGPAPYAELAIDLEIELIAAQYGPRLIRRCLETMGREAMAEISFLREHAQTDVGHTESNFQVVDALIRKYPAFTEALVKTAADALTSYGDFLEEALTRARLTLERTAPKLAATV